MSTVSMPLGGRVYWSLVWSYDNTGNTGSITHSYTSTITTSYHVSILKSDVRQYTETQSTKHVAGFTAGAEYKGVSASVNYSYEKSQEIQNFVSQSITQQTDSTVTKESTETRKYEIGPGSKLELYQLIFEAPGFSYTLDALSTTKKADAEVPITLVLQAIDFVSNINVVYGDHESDIPANGLVKEIHGLSADINATFGGKYVWLVKEYTSLIDNALTDLTLALQNDANPQYSDLAKGAGGSFRYLIQSKDTRQRQKIVEVGLVRRDNASTGEDGWNGISRDLNAGRKGDYLYVVWKTAATRY